MNDESYCLILINIIAMDMFFVIQAIFYNLQMQFGPSTYKWIGFFTPLDVLIGIRAYIVEEHYIYFISCHVEQRYNL